MIIADRREPETTKQGRLYVPTNGSMLTWLHWRCDQDGVEFLVDENEQGDYILATGENTVAVERKTVRDFLNSVSDGRLHVQVNKLLAADYDHVFLLLEGDYWNDEGRLRYNGNGYTQWRFRAFLNLLTYLQMSGVRLVHTASQADSVEALMALHSYFGNQHRQEVRDRVPLSHLREDLGMLAAIKGVGVERAQALLEHFGSVERVVNATVKELTEVSGVGQKTAEHIRQIIEGRR
ncbi:MAG: hypothetical protein C4521_02725 [Actinobacteria bacterium]|nr:MAG: hypothetical protein C4521_02725 [Actinomycetota bacterium]